MGLAVTFNRAIPKQTKYSESQKTNLEDPSKKVEAITHKDLEEHPFPFHNCREGWVGTGCFHDPKDGANRKASRVKFDKRAKVRKE